MIFLIVGGSGFIGSNLSNEILQHGDDVIIFDRNVPIGNRNKVTYVKGDLNSTRKLAGLIKKADIVIHSISSVNPTSSINKYSLGYSLDINKSVKIFDAILKYKKRLIYLSSGGTVYGEQKKFPIVETTPFGPLTNHYAVIKTTIESAAIVFKKQQSADILIARISNPFGGYPSCKKGVGFLDTAIKNAIRGYPIVIYGNGNTIRDYIDIKEVCKIIYKISTYSGKEYIFNISTGRGISQNEIVNFIKKSFPNVRVIYKPFRSIDLKCSVLNNNKIKNIFNYKPTPIKNSILYYIKQINFNKNN